MSESIILYEKFNDPDYAYMIKSGKLKWELTPEDNFEINCKNVVVGGGEILLSSEQGYTETRHFTLSYILEGNDKGGGKVIKLSPNQIIDGVKVYKVAFHTARFIAEGLTNINDIRSKRLSELNQTEQLLREYSVVYAKSIKEINKFFEQKGFPWLEKLVREGTNTLIYKKGEAFVRSDSVEKIKIDSKKLDKYKVTFPKGSFLCNQGDVGTELYKIEEGTVKVIVNGNEVMDIQEGNIVGEMALLLGETRTASLKAIDDCTITVIAKKDLPSIIEDDPNFFKDIIINLSKREKNSTDLLEEIYETRKELNESNDELNSRKRIMNYKEEIKDIRDKIRALNKKYEQPFLQDLSTNITKDLKIVTDKYKNLEQ